jgi:hypothetical protein
MNKFVILFLLLAYSHMSLSQKYKRLRAGLGLGVTNGFIAYFEPSFRITDKISVGYRSEGGVFFFSGFETYQMASKGGVIQYYFEVEDVRIFIGLGLASYKCSPSNYSRADDPTFGFFPRIGYDAGHLTLCIDYNLINDFKVSTYAPHSFSSTEMSNRNYLSIKIGMTIGGGRKKEVENTYSPVLPQ